SYVWAPAREDRGAGAQKNLDIARGRLAEARLAHVQLDGAPALGVEGRHVGGEARGDDDELVRAGLDVGDLQPAGAVGDGADLRAVDEHPGAADVGLHHDGRLQVAHGDVDRAVAPRRNLEGRHRRL